MGAPRVHGIGNLGSDGLLKSVGDSEVLNFSVACSERWKDKRTGENKESTTWLRCDLWGARAKSLAPHLKKGTRVFIEGNLKCTVKEDEGGRKEFWSVNVDQLEFAGGKQDSEGGGNSRYGTSGHGANAKHTAPADEFGDGFGGGGSDELPF